MESHRSASAPAAAPKPSGDCVPGTPGCYRELTPHEFNARKELGVVLLKTGDTIATEFQGFRAVYTLACSTEIDAVLSEWPRDAALGLVCADGDCSSRLAIRLSRQGYTVYHLAGGLREWRQCTVA